MTNDEMQRAMEFILEQQARITAGFEQRAQERKEEQIRLEAERARDASRMTRLEESFQILVQLAQTTDARLDSLESRTATLEQNHSRLEANMSALAEAQRHLAESQAHADQRLSALIDIVIEGRNGKS
jgi:Skp family chaperone for outer membrane proteins